MDYDERIYKGNEITEEIILTRKLVEDFDDPAADPRIKAMVRTKLQEAEVLSLLLFPNDMPHA